MENQQEIKRITDQLLDVFNYAFVESVPYAFFIPKEDKYVAVNLKDKVCHCQSCGKTIRVRYRQNGVTYFSKGRLAAQRRIYEQLGITFPTMGDLADEIPYTYRVIGYCGTCAEQAVMKSEDAAQQVCNLAEHLHHADELVVVKAQKLMGDVVQRWLAGITQSEQLLQYDLSTYEALRDLLCAVILQDTANLEAELRTYLDTVYTLRTKLEQLNAAQTVNWRAYAVRSTAVYESMSEELYHEYTVAFPEAGTVGQDFYVSRMIERDKVDMFVQQKRIESLDELLLEAGFQDDWVDWLVEKGTLLTK